ITVQREARCSVAGQLPDEFVTYFPGRNRTMRYSRIEIGSWDEWIWNGEWIFNDNVGDSTALDQFLSAEHVAVLIR
ncbi:MAG: hypothetical protein NXI32_30960, partial [bacterium]|nr:hypothetical protein [bacterium]